MQNKDEQKKNKKNKKEIIKAVKKLHEIGDVSVLRTDLETMYSNGILSPANTNPEQNHELRFTYKKLSEFLNVIESLLVNPQKV